MMTGFLGNITASGQCYVIAEAGVNHNGDLALAFKLVEAAKEAGANAVKFQLFNPSALSTNQAPLAHYQETAPPLGVANQHSLLEGLALTQQQMAQVAQHCQQVGITFLCTPFEWESAHFLLSTLEVPALKVSSAELNNLPFLRKLGGWQTPLILSTGMGTMEEVEQAVQAIEARQHLPAGEGLALLHCTSAYPAPVEALNLAAIGTLRKCFPTLVIGYSDHSQNLSAVPQLARAQGALIYEKHLTLDKTMAGPDHSASATPMELTKLVSTLRHAELLLGTGVKAPHAVELDCMSVARKSIVTAKALPAGHVLTVDDLVFKRPGTGLAPRFLGSLLERPLRHALPEDHLMAWDDLAE
jgi:sialic acid synthase SpsE